MSAIVSFLQTYLPPELFVFVVSMIPIVELRGAIPLGIAMGLPWYTVLPLSLLGNLLPIPFIMWLIKPIFNLLRKTKLFRGFVEWMERKIQKNSKKVTKYSTWGLFLFVGIPLPGTGAWTGAMVADFLDMRFKNSIFAIALGVLLAGIIVTLISMGVVSGLNFLVG